MHTQDAHLWFQNIPNLLCQIKIWGLWRPSFAAFPLLGAARHSTVGDFSTRINKAKQVLFFVPAPHELS